MKNKILFVIISVVFISTLENLYAQMAFSTDKQVYALGITENDVVVSKMPYGYRIYIRKKGDAQGVRLLVRLSDGKTSFLYVNNTAANNALININKVVLHPTLGNAFYAYIPDTLFLDSHNKNVEFLLKDNISLIAQTYNINENATLNNYITLKTEENIVTKPTINIRSIEKEGDLYAFYLSYSGGSDGEYAFYVREGKTNTVYKIIPTFWGYEKNDNMAIILEDTYQKGIGKKLFIKAYFRELPKERYLAFNIFDVRGKTPTSPVDYIIKGSDIIKTDIAPPLPSSGAVEPAKVRAVVKRVEDTPKRTETVIPQEKKTTTPIRETVIIPPKTNSIEPPLVIDKTVNRPGIESYFDGEAMDSMQKIVDSFKGGNDYINDASELSDKIKRSVLKYNTDSIDVVIVFDTTSSMASYLNAMKSEIINVVGDIFGEYKKARVGFVLYRDIGDSYITKKVEFSDSIDDISKSIKRFSAYGGGDKAEPMYEAIDRALKVFDFEAQTKLIVVVTDAPAKVIGLATLESTSALAKEKGVTLDILLASNKKGN